MALDSQHGHMTFLCDELILQILSHLNSKSILRLSRTCRRLHRICIHDQQLWSLLCYQDFEIKLRSPEPFNSFLHLYKLLHQSREVLRVYVSGNYPVSENCRYGGFPSWLWTWVVFNTNPPYLPSWIHNYYEPFLKYKLSEISHGKVLRVWNLKPSDLPGNLVARVEYGTSYYRWSDIQQCAMRVHGGARGLEKFMLKRCARSRGYVERAYERLFSPCARARPPQNHSRNNTNTTSSLGTSQSGASSGLASGLNVSFRTVRLGNNNGVGNGVVGNNFGALIIRLGNGVSASGDRRASLVGIGSNVSGPVEGLRSRDGVLLDGLEDDGASGSGMITNDGASGSGIVTNDGASGSGIVTNDGASGSGMVTNDGSSGSGMVTNDGASGSGMVTNDGASGSGIVTNDGASGSGIVTNDGASGSGMVTNDGASGSGMVTNDGASGSGMVTNDGASGSGMVTNDGASGSGMVTNDGASGKGIVTNDGASGSGMATNDGASGSDLETTVGVLGDVLVTNNSASGSGVDANASDLGSRSTTNAYPPGNGLDSNDGASGDALVNDAGSRLVNSDDVSASNPDEHNTNSSSLFDHQATTTNQDARNDSSSRRGVTLTDSDSSIEL